MTLSIVRGNVQNVLRNANLDTCKATKVVTAMYNRGYYTEEEYNLMIDMIAGFGITGVI